MLRSLSSLNHFVSKSNVGKRSTSSFLLSLNNSINELPHREVALYKQKSLKWSANHIKTIAVAHGNGIADVGVEPGDRIAIWLPDKAEKHIALLAAAYSGLTVVDVDQDSIETVDDLRQFLKLADCKLIYFDPTTEKTNCLQLLRKAIPEFFDYNDRWGQQFHSKYFPKLKYFVHTGFDVETGCLNYKHLYVTHPIRNSVELVQSSINDETVAYINAFKGPKGWELGGAVTHKELLNTKSWYFAKNIIDKVYYESF